MPILFDYHINYSSDCDNKSSLPFSLFGMSQQGISHIGSSIGNQDAGCVYIGKDVLIGCVADGCTSGTNLNGKSFNQVGAHLTSYLICRLLRKLILKNRIPFTQVTRRLEHDLFLHYKRIRNVLNPWQFESAAVINNLMTSTFIVFLVTKKDYLLLGCGDGDSFVNGENTNLVNESGAYFSTNLFENKQSINKVDVDFIVPIKRIREGKTKDLHSILISTDGFIDNDVKETKKFNSFFFEGGHQELKNGFNDLKFQFRSTIVDKIIEEKDGRIWPLDDATFISLKRISY